MREIDSINLKLFRDTIAQYVTEESDPDKVDYVHRLILLTIGDHEERDEFRYGRPEAGPVPAHGTEGSRVIPGEDDDMPSALDSYLDEIAGLDDWKGQEEPRAKEVKPKKPSAPSQSNPKDAGQDVKASTPQPTPKAHKSPESKPKKRASQGRDNDKVSPYAAAIKDKTYTFPLKDKKQVSAELHKYGFTKKDAELMKQYCDANNKRAGHQWTRLLKAAYTDKRTYGEITSKLHSLATPPRAKYAGATKYEERFKRNSALLHWAEFKREHSLAQPASPNEESK